MCCSDDFSALGLSNVFLFLLRNEIGLLVSLLKKKVNCDQSMAKCCCPLPQCKTSGLQVLAGETPVVIFFKVKCIIFDNTYHNRTTRSYLPSTKHLDAFGRPKQQSYYPLIPYRVASLDTGGISCIRPTEAYPVTCSFFHFIVLAAAVSGKGDPHFS